jgi:tRNA-dihydrouridine synthase B
MPARDFCRPQPRIAAQSPKGMVLFGPISIGSVKIENPVVLAPMAGVTDAPFRALVAAYGEPEFRPSLLVSEMVPSNSQVALGGRAKSPRVRRMFDPLPGGVLTSVQIFGSDPAVMAESAKINEALGAAVVDINMGCPVNKIIKSGSGADLMKNPELAARIVESVVRAVKVPVSVKIRTGWDAGSKNTPEFARRLEGAGASMLAVHGRTRSQLYSGGVDFGAIAAVKRAVKIPVIGNGDITSPELAKKMLERTGCDGVMVGRGACGAPWLLSQIVRFLKTGELAPEPSVAEKREILLSHLAAMMDYYGERVALLNSRKHIAWYSRGLRGSAEFRAAVNSCASFSMLGALVRKFFA